MPVVHQFRAVANTSNVLLITKIVTISSMGIYAGSALNFNTVIMPSLRRFAWNSSLSVWGEMFILSKPIQFTSIMTSVIGGSILFYQTRNPYYLAGAAMMGSILFYTNVLLHPIHAHLLDIRKHSREEPSVEEMLIQWDAIHFGRTLLSYGAMVVTLYAALSGPGYTRVSL
ncbi:hypothetical protein BCR41DRAFT_388303 [Lobosporangium transversale]|uniref:DUF1772-domain-containing protein n=1 Tax=Lobosporangium transversale TaxID=64571 RepID=A0A1Y2GFA7_9FUNG|nr:hypothetical protein BCR41DRAFT_388303 [Lobosporangium transversale]ORZ09332.1 hypothetical protein BCR41DRAFT_388303 [Lobosporangium transversale]|eukprot:XP_021878785.1 hypothetical protein BCR41DRAFT_388303 [Lobosporangium transversale]